MISHDLDIFEELAGFSLKYIKTLVVILSRGNKRRHGSIFPTLARQLQRPMIEIKNGSRDYYCTLDHVICKPLATSFPGSSLFLPRLEGEGGGALEGEPCPSSALCLSLALPLPPATAMQANCIHSDEGLTLVTSAIKSLYGGQFSWQSTLLINIPFYSSLTQHHSFFRNQPPHPFGLNIHFFMLSAQDGKFWEFVGGTPLKIPRARGKGVIILIFNRIG